MGQKLAISSSAMSTASSNSSARLMGVSILRVTPTTACFGDTLLISGVGFQNAKNLIVRFNDTQLDSVQFVNSTCLRCIVPDLETPGPVKVAVSFDGGENWLTHGGFTYGWREEPTIVLHAQWPPPEHTSNSIELPVIVSNTVNKLADKLRPYSQESEESLVATARILASSNKFYTHYFSCLADIAENAALYQAQLTQGIEHIEEGHKKRIEQLLRSECDLSALPVQLILTDVHLGTIVNCSQDQLFQSCDTWCKSVSAQDRDKGFVHAVLQIGPWLFEWQDSIFVAPLPAIFVEALEVDSVMKFYIDVSRDNTLLKEISNICVELNTLDRGAGTHFIKLLLSLFKTLSPQHNSALDLFITCLRDLEVESQTAKHFFFIDPTTNIKTEFPTHTSLDEFCRSNHNTPLLNNEDNARLLHLIDRAFWRDWIFFGEARYDPCTAIGCYFGDPEVITPKTVPIARATSCLEVIV